MLPDLIAEFRRYQHLAQEALAELDDLSFFKRPAPQVNPIAVIVKHVAGNLRSRWTDFMTTDGAKPDRNRNGEFQVAEDDSRERLMDAWNEGWNCLLASLEGLSEGDLARTIPIRGEAHTVSQAIVRSLAHTAYHVGQILYLVRMMRPESKWLTIPPGQSQSSKGQYLRRGATTK